MRSWAWIFLFSGLWLPVGQAKPGAENSMTSVFARANHAYLESNYAQASVEYKKLIDVGLVHPDLFFNLANAYYQAGRIGLSILYYEKTLLLDPGDSAAKSNLTVAKKKLIDRIVMPARDVVGEPLWHGFIRSLSLGWLTWLFLSFYAIVFVLLFFQRFVTESKRRFLFWINVPLISVVLVLGSLFAARVYVQERVHHGIVINNTVVLREGPERSANVILEIHEGLKVRILTQVSEFIRVRLANGVEGFVSEDQVGRI
jgi:hypothetical protein